MSKVIRLNDKDIENLESYRKNCIEIYRHMGEFPFSENDVERYINMSTVELVSFAIFEAKTSTAKDILILYDI